MTDNPREVVSFNDRLAQFNMARSLVTDAWQRYQSRKQAKLTRSQYFVTVEDDEALFGRLQTKLMKSADPRGQQSVLVETRRDFVGDDLVYGMNLAVETDYSSFIQIGDYSIQVEITTEKVADRIKPATDESILSQMFDQQKMLVASGYQNAMSRRVIFTCRNRTERDAVLAYLEEEVENMSSTKRSPSFYAATTLGGWRRTSTIMRRPLDAVVLEGDGRERIVADLEWFINSEQRYIELGLPWHHGYLLEGPPGTGKTSLASALASKFGFDVYYIALSAVESDAKLLDLITQIDSGQCLLVLEDVDIARATRQRDDERKGITLQGLLNALDGIATPHGLVTVMTTNVLEGLDPALIRPGRVDFQLHVGYITDEQMTRLCERFIGRVPDLPAIHGNITPAEVVGIFKDGDNNQVDKLLTNLILEANIRVRNDNFPREGVHVPGR